jgi:hypothetical protein
MPTCRAIILEAMRAIKAIAPGDDPEADELIVGLEAVRNVILDLHEARGPMRDIDLTGDYTPGENQRCRVQLGYTVNVTLPNSIQMYPQIDPFDYGFTAPAILPWPGSTAPADGLSWRQPRDGTRIEVVGVTNALYFYRADIDQWMSAYGLAIDQEIPLNARYASALGALVGERLMEVSPDASEPTPGFQKRINRAREALFVRPGVSRPPVHADYF